MKLVKANSSQMRSLQQGVAEAHSPIVATEELLENGQVQTAPLGALAKLPPFGPVAVSLMRLFDRDDVEIYDIVRLVSSDAALTSQLLALANSPLFGVQTSIVDLQHAVTVLGIERTKALSITLAMHSFLSNTPKTPILAQVWRHGLATAVIAEILAPCYGLPKDLGHVAGILHDVGRVALLAAYPDEYATLANQAHVSVESILVAERRQFGLDHCQAGHLLSESWRFPNELQEVAAYHLEPPGGQDLLSLVQTACRLAVDLGFAAVARQDHQTKPTETIEAHVPAAIREQVFESMRKIDQQILDRLESLDF